MSKTKVFRRYTSIATALDMLRHKRITLLEPSKWDDQNDAEFMEIYKNCIRKKNIFALCGTTVPETYHHWKVFSQGIDGCCIHVDLDLMRHFFSQKRNVRFEKVEYYTMSDLQKRKKIITSHDLPFAKRYAFRDEREYRAIYTNDQEGHKIHNVDFDPNQIDRIILNPWLPDQLVDTLKNVLKEIDKTINLTVHRSRITNSAPWLKFGRNAL